MIAHICFDIFISIDRLIGRAAGNNKKKFRNNSGNAAPCKSARSCCDTKLVKKKKKFRRIRRRFQGAVRFRRLIRRLNRRLAPAVDFFHSQINQKENRQPVFRCGFRQTPPRRDAHPPLKVAHIFPKKNPSIIGHFFQQLTRWNPVSQMALLVIGQISTKLSAAALAARYKRHGRFTAAQKTWTSP